MGFMPNRSKVVMRHLLERNAEEQPEKQCAVFENGETWTWNVALQEAYKSVNQLTGLGIERGEKVLLFLPNGEDWVRSWIGITSMGAIMVPVNTAYKGEVLRHICGDSQANHIITTTAMGERLQGLGLDLNIIDPATLAEAPANEPKLDQPIEPWDTCAIMYTSGTTGPSKGVITPYFHLYMHGIQTRFRAKPEDTMLIDLPLFHGAGLLAAFALWAVGGRIAVREVFSQSRYFHIIRETGSTMATMVKTMAEFLMASPPKPDDADHSLRAAGCTPMVNDPAAFMRRFGIQDLYTGYSQTEISCPIFTTEPVTDPGRCGKARQGMQLRLVDKNDIPVPEGEAGELVIRTDLPWELNAGYYRHPEKTAEAWRNGWFHTGDMFRCDKEGNYYFIDRETDAVRRRGENISSFEVEREVMAHPDVFEAACVAAPAESGEHDVKVFVIPREGADFDPAGLIKFLIPRMPYFMVPRFVEVVDEFPRTITMKAKKAELRARGNSEATWDREIAGIVVKRE